MKAATAYRAAMLLLLASALFGGWELYGKSETSATAAKAKLQSFASPGRLSAAHGHLAGECGACHMAIVGVEDGKCIACHSSATSLLQRQPTSFHAVIGNCASCHVEHQGEAANLRQMDHEKLAQLGLELLGRGSDGPQLRAQLLHWIEQHPMGRASTASHPHLAPVEMTLNCVWCHSTKDRHQGLFGVECASCHGTSEWTVAEFQHPGPGNFDCAQCHQAPPSHYMMHFSMVSKRVARQEHEGVRVNQCYLCHQTTSWNDIKGVGWYKHH